MNSIKFPEMNYKHFREKNAKFHIFLLFSIMCGISLITIYDRKFRHNRPEEGLPKMITYISPINMVAEDNHLYFAYKSPLGLTSSIEKKNVIVYICFPMIYIIHILVKTSIYIYNFHLIPHFQNYVFVRHIKPFLQKKKYIPEVYDSFWHFKIYLFYKFIKKNKVWTCDIESLCAS